MKMILIKIFDIISLFSLNIGNYLRLDDVSMSKAIYTESGRYIRYTVVNNKSLEVKELLRLVYNRLITDSSFRNFGEKKVIIINATTNLSGEEGLHPNVFITNTTTFEDYYSRIINYINYQLIYDNYEVIETLNIKIWNLDLLINKNIT